MQIRGRKKIKLTYGGETREKLFFPKHFFGERRKRRRRNATGSKDRTPTPSSRNARRTHWGKPMYEQMSRATTKFARKKEERTKRNASTIRAMSVAIARRAAASSPPRHLRSHSVPSVSFHFRVIPCGIVKLRTIRPYTCFP